MKKFRIFLILAVAAFITSSCEDDKELAILDNENAVASTILTPANSSAITLTAAEGAAEFAFTWTAADYGPVLPYYSNLFLDVTGNTFKKPIKVYRTTGELSYLTTNAEMNLILYDAGVTETVEAYFRVTSTVKDPNVDTLISPDCKVSITPFAYNKSVISAPANGSSYVLKEADKNEPFDAIVWDAVNYGAEYPTVYNIEMDKKGNNFAAPVVLASATATTATVKVGVLNIALIKLGLTAGVATDVELRVVASADGKKRGIVKGETTTLKITPFGDVIVDPGNPPLYLVGAATLAGWDASNGVELAWDEANQEYSTITTFTTGGMKILKEAGKWAPQWGDDGSFTGVLSFRPDEATADPAEIPSPGEGSFKIRVDIVNLTYAFEAQ